MQNKSSPRLSITTRTPIFSLEPGLSVEKHIPVDARKHSDHGAASADRAKPSAREQGAEPTRSERHSRLNGTLHASDSVPYDGARHGSRAGDRSARISVMGFAGVTGSASVVSAA
jgi:hypothetical protein